MKYRDNCRLSKEVSLLGGPTTQFDSESLFDNPFPASTSDALVFLYQIKGIILILKNPMTMFSYPSYKFKYSGHVGRKRLKRLQMFEEADNSYHSYISHIWYL